MSFKKCLSQKLGIPVEELDTLLSIKETEENIFVYLEKEVDKRTFKKIARTIQKFGGQYVRTRQYFKIPHHSGVDFEEIVEALRKLPEEIKFQLSLELRIKPHRFLEASEFKKVVRILKKVGGKYLASSKQFKIIVNPPEYNVEKELLEKIKRTDVSDYERAKCMQRLISEFNYTHEQLAMKLKKSRPWVTNHLRMLSLKGQLPPEVLERTSEGMARALLSIPEKARGKVLSKYAQLVRSGHRVSIRELYNWADHFLKGEKPSKSRDKNE